MERLNANAQRGSRRGRNRELHLVLATALERVRGPHYDRAVHRSIGRLGNHAPLDDRGASAGQRELEADVIHSLLTQVFQHDIEGHTRARDHAARRQGSFDRHSRVGTRGVHVALRDEASAIAAAACALRGSVLRIDIEIRIKHGRSASSIARVGVHNTCQTAGSFGRINDTLGHALIIFGEGHRGGRRLRWKGGKGSGWKGRREIEKEEYSGWERKKRWRKTSVLGSHNFE